MPSVLIVDDEELTCWALGKSLRVVGWRVSCAHSAEAGLEKLQEAPVDILVADIGLPEMDGLTLVKEVRSRWPKTRCVVITASWDASVRGRAEAAGAMMALAKPLDLDAFKRTLAAVAPRERPPRGAP